MEDLDLLNAWRGGDKQAGNALFQRHFASIRRFFINKTAQEVEDLIQRTFVACVEGLDRCRNPANFRGYLLGIAHNVLREHFRAKVRAAKVVDIEKLSIRDMGAGPSTLMAEQREHRLLLEGLRTLPLALQVVLELHFWERMTGAEIGEALGIPENTARSRLRRAKEQLLAAVQRLGDLPGDRTTTADNLDRWSNSLRPLLGPPLSG